MRIEPVISEACLKAQERALKSRENQSKITIEQAIEQAKFILKNYNKK